MASIDTADGAARRYFGPYHIARWCTLAALAFAAGFIWLSLQMPVADARFAPAPQGVTVTTADGAFAVAPDAMVDFGALRIAADRLADVEAAGDPDRAALADLLRAGPAQARVTDAAGVERGFTVDRRNAAFRDFTATYWLDLTCGLFGMLFAVAVWAARPREWAPVCFFWTGVFVFASSCTDALFELWNVATTADIAMAVVVANAAVLHPFALVFVALFARFPKPLIGKRALFGVLGVAAVAALASTIAIPAYGLAAAGAVQGVAYLAILVLALVQMWAGRKDKASRQAMTILGATIGLGVVLYLLVTIAPTIRGVQAPLQEAIAFPVFMLIFAGIGIAIVRASLFSMDGWVRTVMASVIFIALVILVDVALLSFLARQDSVALGLSFAAVALIYFPVRETLSRRAQKRREARTRQSLRLASDLVFAATDEARAARWADAVQATFQPLETARDPAPGAAPQVAGQGEALRLPSVAGAPALVCRHADGGRRAFGKGDVEAAQALIAIVERMIAARNAYVQGVSEERVRIARDLHDDVGGRLTTSLHRREADAVKMDVREAIADIRTIVSGLAGEPRLLGHLLGELRHECLTRCEAAGVALDWPLGPELEDERRLDYRIYRHILALVREAVSNIIRHSGAANARIEVARTGETLAITISDDGRGIVPGGPAGNGLRNSAARARELGGAFEVLAPERGAAVRFEARLTA